jgi:hypothetical protein
VIFSSIFERLRNDIVKNGVSGQGLFLSGNRFNSSTKSFRMTFLSPSNIEQTLGGIEANHHQKREGTQV